MKNVVEISMEMNWFIKQLYKATLYDQGNVCNFCRICTVLFVIVLLTSISIRIAFIYFHWYLKRSDTNVATNVNANTEAVIY